MDGSGKEQGLLAASESLSTSVAVLLSGGVQKGPLFLGREEQSGRQQDSSGWPALFWKKN